MKTIVMGDIHGCYDEFLELMEVVDLDLDSDRLILLGDYIDRGDKSFEVVQKISRLHTAYGSDHVVLLRGNHEQMAIDYLERGRSSYLCNGGGRTIKSFNDNHDDMKNYINFFKSLPLYYEDSTFLYVHAGLRPGVTLKEQSKDDLLWIRDEFFLSSCVYNKVVIFGHTPTPCITGDYKPTFFKRKLAIDTACVYGGCLTALEIQDGKIVKTYQVDSKRATVLRSII